MTVRVRLYLAAIIIIGAAVYLGDPAHRHYVKQQVASLLHVRWLRPGAERPHDRDLAKREEIKRLNDELAAKNRELEAVKSRQAEEANKPIIAPAKKPAQSQATPATGSKKKSEESKPYQPKRITIFRWLTNEEAKLLGAKPKPQTR